VSGLTGVGRDVTERTRAEEILPQVYRNAVEECRLADELGFDVVWLAEHHFSAYGICPSLAPLAGAIAGATRCVRIGTAVVIAPFEHPLRIAEEWPRSTSCRAGARWRRPDLEDDAGAAPAARQTLIHYVAIPASRSPIARGVLHDLPD